MTSPAVSVLVPCWNARVAIERALESVLAERRVDLEVVVVDDGSTDGTAEVVREIAARDPRVVLVALEANGGVSNARNRGLERVRGEWLTLLDADDRFLPGGLASLHATAIARDALAVVGQQVWSDGRHHWIGPLYDRPDIRRPGRKSLATAPGLVYYASPHGKLFHRSTWDGLTFEGRVLGDQPWVLRALLRAGDRIEVLGETVYEWIRTPAAGAAPSITAATRSSAERGVEATNRAARAFADVLAEAELEVADTADRWTFAETYAERLLRSDLGFHLARALDRADPAVGDLLDAIRAFLATLPLPSWPGRTTLHEIIEPPLRRWPRVAIAGRPAFDALVADQVSRHPMLAESGRSELERWALRRLLGRAGVRPDRAAFAALRLAAAARTVRAAPRLIAAARRRLPFG